jgi:iron complex transport system ATP-binding protein
MSLVPQAPTVAFDYRVDEMIKMGRYSISSETGYSIDEALETVDALQLRHRSILSLSAGERQRIYIARALVTDAPILFFDEPTSALDIRHQLEIWQLLRSLADKGRLVVVATHDLAATTTYCNSASLLHRGSCFASGPPKEVLSPDHLCEVFGLSLTDQKLAKTAIQIG